MNLSELKELLELIAARDITEFELEDQGVKIRIKKSGAPNGAAADFAVEAQEARAILKAAASAPESAAAPAPGAASEEAERADVTIVKAPMVGTFYRQPSPGADPFVSVGDAVKKGQILCIIEAMKLMNEIESELAGEIVDVYVEDGQPVQFGDKLFGIRET